MYHRMRRKHQWRIVYSAIFTVQCLIAVTNAKSIITTDSSSTYTPHNDDFSYNNIIDFDDGYEIKLNKKYSAKQNWNAGEDFKDSYRYMIDNDKVNNNNKLDISTIRSKDNSTSEIEIVENTSHHDETSTTEPSSATDLSVIPLELISTTENVLARIVDSTTDSDLTVIPLSTTTKIAPTVDIAETGTLPTSTDIPEDTTTDQTKDETTVSPTTMKIEDETKATDANKNDLNESNKTKVNTTENVDNVAKMEEEIEKQNDSHNSSRANRNETSEVEEFHTISTEQINILNRTDRIDTDEFDEEDKVPIFTELDLGDSSEVPEDYYDVKDQVSTKAPSTDALSVIFGLAGSVVESVVESVAERVVPKGIYELFKRMQKQNEALEAERLRSREENGGLGQFGRGILKTISSGLTKPFTQLMAGARDIGSLDNDRSFVTSLASGVTSVANVANSLSDAFKDRVQAIYPGTVWCGDGRSATARSGDLGLFFFTDTCCRQHDACKIYIRAGDTKYGLTNTGLFTRSHCSCDSQFRECLKKTNSLVSAQIGLTYFNVLGPQCLRRAHPITRCLRRTRITGQKCEEYELDYSKPKMWQWFDNETF